MTQETYARECWNTALQQFQERIGHPLASFCDQPAWKEFCRGLGRVWDNVDTANQAHKRECTNYAMLCMMNNAHAAGTAFRRSA